MIDLGSEVLWLVIAFELKGSEYSYGDNHHTRDQPMAFKHVHDVILVLPASISNGRCQAPASLLNPPPTLRLRIESFASVEHAQAIGSAIDGWYILQHRYGV